MKIWRDDITKEKLRSGSALSASMGLLFMLGGSFTSYYPEIAVVVCMVLACVCVILSVILGVKAKRLKEK